MDVAEFQNKCFIISLKDNALQLFLFIFNVVKMKHNIHVCVTLVVQIGTGNCMVNGEICCNYSITET